MKTKTLLSVLLGGIVASAILVSSTTTAERSIAQTPMEAAEGYFDAIIAKDKEGMMFYAKDTNYLDEKSREEGYREDLKTNPTSSYEIVGSKQINSNEFELSVILNYSGEGYKHTPPLPYKVFKSENSWKVLVEPLEINTLTGDVKKGMPIYKWQYTDS
ncbi:hypothetical protein [Paenibacillus lautus]|uniref:hypothetical protein n=1 Tax=Paenibacillus lautus TaxID=1401 RepID=UPI000FDC6BA5|nr:hypothetical protein [Paenibacillus lautus]